MKPTLLQSCSSVAVAVRFSVSQADERTTLSVSSSSVVFWLKLSLCSQLRCVITGADQLHGRGFLPGSSNMMMWNYTHNHINMRYVAMLLDEGFTSPQSPYCSEFVVKIAQSGEMRLRGQTLRGTVIKILQYGATVKWKNSVSIYLSFLHLHI